jgi:Ser/Thr protein kinase RdoA (MazF antagonist)
MGRFIGRLHGLGARRRFEHRLTLGVAGFGVPARDAIVAHRADDDPASLAAWIAACDAALELIARAFETTRAATLRLHGDCHRGNLLWSDAGPHFVDLDDACNGPAMQDLWMLLDGDRTTARQQLAELINGYSDFRDFDWRETALIEPLRTLRMIHYSGWIARRWHDPAFPAAFPWFGSASYWSQHAADLREQIEAMRDAASARRP